MPQLAFWPYLPTFARLALALAIGLAVGVERERRRKEAGLRTFAFCSLVCAVGGLLGQPYALLALGLVGVLIILLNLETIRTGEGAEITTSAALLVTAFTGVLSGQGQTVIPTALGVVTAALLAWKEPLAGFSRALTESELRSALLLAILGFVIYPVLPPGSVDRWHLVEPRAAWVTVVLIAALGFFNYILLKLYGTRGIELTGFLGGLVNSTVTVTELANRTRDTAGRLAEVAYRGVALATAAMLVRNAVILVLLAPPALQASIVPFTLMLAAAGTAALFRRPGPADDANGQAMGIDALPALASPFSLTAAIRFGLIFLALQVGGTLAQRALGHLGFYAVCLIGGFVSSASAVASAGTLAAAGTLPPSVAGLGAVLASLSSALVNLPLVARVAGNRLLTRRIAWVLGAVAVLGALGVLLQGTAR